MKVLRIHGAGDVRLHEEAEPVPVDGEVLLHVTAVGLCGSDRHWFLDAGIGDDAITHPLVLGHEFAGVIASGPRTGQRVAGEPTQACGRCERCLAGQQHLCTNHRFAGHGRTDGALRELMAWPDHLLFPLPDDVSDGAGAVLEALGVALHGLDLGHVTAASTASVHGCGPIGLLLVQLLAMQGCSLVIALDPLAHRVHAAAAHGATDTIVATDPVTDEAAIRDLTGGRGVDIAFEVAGPDAAVKSAVRAARPGGRVVLIGIPYDDTTSFPASIARRKGLTILVSRRMTSADLPRAISLAGAGRVDVESVISERFPLAGAPAAFEALGTQRGLKVLIEPWKRTVEGGANDG